MTRRLLLIFILLHAHICLAEQLFIKRDNGSLKYPTTGATRQTAALTT